MRTEDRRQNPEVRSQKFHPETFRGRGHRFRSLITDHRSPFTRRSAFTLVEVTLALAVMAIGLIAILGLIPQGVQSSRGAADNTIAATIVQDTFSRIRQNVMTVTWPPTPPWPSPITASTYYDVGGTNIETAAQNQYFLVQLTSSGGSEPNLLVITATVTWPANSSMTALPINTKVFVTEIARYQ